MADPRAQALLKRYEIEGRTIDLSRERSTAHGRFIYNLHLVLVNAGRWREVHEERLARTRRMVVQVAAKKGHLLSRGAIVADHLHLMLGGGIAESPLEIAMAYMNNLAFAHGMTSVLEHGYYVGTFGEYDLGAVRRHL